jgi:hypothetical protein
MRTHIALAKFLEELGRLQESFEHIEGALRILPAGHALDFQIRAQKLRMLASFGREGELAKYYHECLGVSETRPQIVLECFHALLIAEARVLGFNALWPRLEDFGSRAEIQAADLRLVLIDLLEISLEMGDHDASARLLTALEQRGELIKLDEFEGVIVSLARAKTISAEDLFRWTRTLTPMSRLRALALTLKLRLGDEENVRRQLALHLESFDHLSRKMLTRKWGQNIEAAEQVEIVIDRTRKEILFNQRSLGLNKSAQTWDLILALAELPAECPPEKLLQALGKVDSSHNQESLRISLLRLNKKLAVLLGLGWAVKFGKQKIALHPQIRLKAM